MFNLSGMGGGGLALEGLGAAGQLVGGLLSASANSGVSKSQQNIADLQEQLNGLNASKMELDARRGQMETLRNEQRARSLALTNAAGQGAQFGSGLSGGFGQIQGVSGNNLLGINQNLRIGRQENTVNTSIIAQQRQVAKYQGQGATGSGISSLAGGVSSFGKDFISVATNPSGSTYPGYYGGSGQG